MATIKVGALTPDQRDLVLSVVKDYLITSGLLKRIDGIRVYNQPENIYVQNADSVAVPAFGCVQVTGTATYDGGTVITAARPVDTTGTAGKYLFNGPVEIGVGRVGIAYDGPLVRVLTDGSGVTCGAGWSPVVAQWYVAPTAGGLLSAVGTDVIATNVIRAFYGFLTQCKPPVTDIRIDGLNFQLSRDCEDNWETWATGGECP
jgi:hypothetical protein